MPPASLSFDFDALRRHPDVESDNLFAVDASDRLILDEAAASLAGLGPGELVVIGDHYGALTLGAIALHEAVDVRVHQDALTGELALKLNARRAALADFEHHELGASLLTGARVVLMQLPRSLGEALALLRDERDLAEVLGADFITVYTEVKEIEYAEFMKVISPWEREHLLLHV